MSTAFTFASIARRIDRRAGRHLPLSQYRVLAMAATSEATAGRLALFLELAKPTITASVDALVDEGLLVRRAVEGDRRSVRLEVTPAGQDVLERVEADLADLVDDLVERCADPHAVRAALDQLAVAVEHRAAEREAAKREQREQREQRAGR